MSKQKNKEDIDYLKVYQHYYDKYSDGRSDIEFKVYLYYCYIYLVSYQNDLVTVISKHINVGGPINCEMYANEIVKKLLGSIFEKNNPDNITEEEFVDIEELLLVLHEVMKTENCLANPHNTSFYDYVTDFLNYNSTDYIVDCIRTDVTNKKGIPKKN